MTKTGRGRAIPNTLEEADAADKMLWTWRVAGRGWKDIQKEWERITTKKPGDGTLSARYGKMQDSFAAHGALDVSSPRLLILPPLS